MKAQENRKDSLTLVTAEEAVATGGQLNPDWVEWLMGWPEGWTDLKPLGMDKFQVWLDSHGTHCQEEQSK